MNTEADIELRKKQKCLDKNHWMCRIQKYVFGIDAPTYYMGYCPFFWMTWLAVLCFPFVALIGAVSSPFMWLAEKITFPVRAVKTVRENARTTTWNTPRKPTYKEMYSIALDYITDHEIEGPADLARSWHFHIKDYNRVYLWIKANPDWRETELPKAKQWKKEQDELAEEELRKDRLKRIKANTITSFCGVAFFKVFIPILILAAFTGVCYLMYTLCTTISLIDVVAITGIGLTGYACYMAAVIIWSGIHIYVQYSLRDKPSGTMFGANTILAIIKPFRWFFTGVAHVIEFLIDTVKLTYKQECPLIIWGEETGKIEKRKK